MINETAGTATDRKGSGAPAALLITSAKRSLYDSQSQSETVADPDADVDDDEDEDYGNYERWKKTVAGVSGEEKKKAKEPLSVENDELHEVKESESTMQSHMIDGAGFYSFGIIDILQSWNMRKKCERVGYVYACCYDGDGLTCIEPDSYRKRFLAKMHEIGLGKKSKKRKKKGRRKKRKKKKKKDKHIVSSSGTGIVTVRTAK